MDKLAELMSDLPRGANILDPFAGVGTIHQLAGGRFNTFGMEIEREWADAHPLTSWGDSRQLVRYFPKNHFDAIVTSPAYGNRMADRLFHSPSARTSRRMTYTISLGRPLSEGNAAGLQWSGKQKVQYQDLHRQVWDQCFRVLKPGGLIFVNVSNHIRRGELQKVVEWHEEALVRVGFVLDHRISVKTQRMKMGANYDKRAPNEVILMGHKEQA